MKRATLLPISLALAMTTAQAQTVVQAWVQRYHGPGNNSDIANAIAVDKNGNVFVTGYSYLTNGLSDYATVAYSSTGLPLWTNRYNETATGSRAQTSAMALDSSGNVIATGWAGGGPGDYSTIKYSGAGIPLWTNRYGGRVNGSDLATAIAVGTNGNVFVTGSSSGAAIFSDYATIAYSSEGIALWTNRYNGPVNGEDAPTAIAVDVNGNVFVTGGSGKTTMSPANPAAYATIKYSGDGMPLWTNRFADGGTSVDERPTAIAVDGVGNVFVTGYSSGGVGPNYATIAYSSAGVGLWTNRYSGPGSSSSQARAIAVDSGGNVFVTGSSSNGTNTDYLTLAYSNAGMPLWTKHYDSGGSFAAIAVDTIGNVYVAGLAAGNGGIGDYATIKYSLSVPLVIQTMDDQVVVSWTNAAFGWTNLDFRLQSAPAVTGTFTDLPGATSPYTNPVTGAQQFFRLISN